MNKNDIKKALTEINPDEYLGIRLEAKINNYAHPKSTRLKKLTLSSAAFCCLLIIGALAIGINLAKAPDYVTSGKITANQAAPESETATVNTDDTTNGEALSNPDWLNQTQEVIDNKNVELIVNGKSVTGNHYIKFSSEADYADISLTAILEELGGKIIWINNESADVHINGKHYIMGARDGDFCEVKSTTNLFADEDGAIHANPQIINNEFVMDNHSIENLMKNLGYNMTIDFQTKTITIE